MKRVARTLFTVFALPLVAALWVGIDSLQSSDETSTLAAVYSAELHNLGPVCEGDSLLFAASVRNTSEDVLVIKRAFADCGCTSVVTDVAGRKLLPGGQVGLAATYTADSPGDFDRSIRIALSDGRTIRHRFIGTVVPAVEIVPPSLHSEDSPDRLVARVVVNWGEPLTIHDAELHPPGDYTLNVVDVTDNEAVLTVTPRRPSPQPYRGTVFLRLQSPIDETLTVPVRIGMPAGPTLAAAGK